MSRGQKILLALLVISIFLNYIDRSNLSLAAPVMQKEYGLSTRDIGTLSSAFFWTYALLQLFGIAGWLADRYSPGLVLAGGLAIWSAATILTGVLSGIPMLFAARLLVGAGESVAYPCYSRIFASAISSERRGVANAMLDAASKLGPALGTLAGGALLASVGWRMFFVALGCLSFLWLLPWLQFLKVAPRAVQSSKAGPTTVEILGKRSAWGAFLGHFCGNYFWFFLLTWLPTYLVNERGLAMSRMVNVTTLAYLAMAASTLCAGWISDRWIASGATATHVRKTVVCCGLGCSVMILPVAVVRDGTAALALLVLACMSFGAYTSNHWAITQTLAGPLAAGRWTSLQNGVGNLSGIVAAWLTGIVVEQTHSFVLPFAIASAIAVAGALLWGVVVEDVRPVEWGK
jgi:MFS family permease